MALEVKKLEILQSELKKELEKIEEELPVDKIVVDDNLGQLIMDIKAMDNKIVNILKTFNFFLF